MENLKGIKIDKENGGFIKVDKPTGITSFTVIRILRHHFGKLKMGHSGTLDPFATGLLLIAYGKKTKELTSLIGLDKEYKAIFLLGKKTTTMDPDGEVISQKNATHLTDTEIKKAVKNLLGKHNMPAPYHSAVKVQGKPLYKYAHTGKKPPFIPKKPMTVHSIEIIDIKRDDLFVYVKVFVKVASGTYIRSLSELLGQSLKIPAMLTSLRRLSIGEYSISDAIKI